MLSSQFRQLKNDLNLSGQGEGGFTVDAKTGVKPSSGIMVSAPTGEQQVPKNELTTDRLAAYAGNMDTSTPYHHFGGWNPGGGADVSLDSSRRIMPSPSVKKEYGENVARADAMTSALDIGIANQQEAVFRLDDFATVRTGIQRDDIKR